MMKILSRVIFLLLFISTSHAKAPSEEDIKKNNFFFMEVMNIVNQKYVEDVDYEKLVEEAIEGAIQSLDPHSDFLNRDQYKEIGIQTNGEFGGIGVEIVMQDSLVKVVSPIEGTPAYKAGIITGDYIMEVDGKNIFEEGYSLHEVVEKIRGKIGTKIKLQVIRKGEKEPLDFNIEREKIQVKAVRSDIYDNIGYVKINTFSKQAYNGLKKEILGIKEILGDRKMDGFILDLRNNPGGLLDQSIYVSNAFLGNDKVIVSIKGKEKDDYKEYKTKSDEYLIPNIPMVVLINQGSASASEIVAGALQDNKRAIIMGERSFGKGSVQSIIRLNGDRGMKITTARYYTPNNRSIQALGIEPDISVQNAKLEVIDSVRNLNEASLKGHLEKEAKNINKKGFDDNKELNTELYKKDYQLARAIDLLKGMVYISEIK